MPRSRLKNYRLQIQKIFSETDMLFLVLRLGTILGSSIWLFFAPLSKSIAINYNISLAIFTLYSLVLYVLIFFNPDKIRPIYIFSLLLDLIFIFYLVHLEPEYHNSFFLCYYLLVLLHTLYFGHFFGLLVASISAGLYFVNIQPYFESIHWTDLAIRIIFFFLIGFPAGIIHGKLHKDKQNIEKLNKQLAESIKNIKAMQQKLVESEKLSALGRLTQGVAHEIRNPLMSLGGISHRLLKRLADNSKEKKYAQFIITEVDRLETILRDVLLFTSGKSGIKRQHLNPIVKDATEYFMDLHSNNKSYKILNHLNPDLPTIYIDKEQLRQAIGNLISNSIDAMPQGGIISINTDIIYLNEMDWVSLTIKDTGSGMSQDQTKLIFEPFYSTKQVSTGLGLTIVHEIMEEHRGFIQAESTLDTGTTFTLYFPYQPIEEDALTPCWECLGCGIESDPSKRCPAFPYFGRSCWAIAGTMCQGKIRGTYAEKTNNCHQCPFFLRRKNPHQPDIPVCPAG